MAVNPNEIDFLGAQGRQIESADSQGPERLAQNTRAENALDSAFLNR